MSSSRDPFPKEFSDIDYWRLSENLSVTHASMLAAGIDPGDVEAVLASNPVDGRFHLRDAGNRDDDFFTSGKFIAVFSAIRLAILTNKLRANIARLARHSSLGDTWESDLRSGESHISYDILLVADGDTTTIKTNVDMKEDPWGRYGAVYYIEEPDWRHTSVDVGDLTEWMGKRNFRPPFFFPEAAEGFRDPRHPRYSSKLACAVAAWEAIERSKPNKSVKATILEWVQANAVTFGMVEADGLPSAAGVEEVAKVANWEPKGGANRTGGEAIETEEAPLSRPIQNLTEMKEMSRHSTRKIAAFEPGDDIPF